MQTNNSPLRYPGGKFKMFDFVVRLLYANKFKDVFYIEPYAGGASVALSLLFREFADEVLINDYDRSVYAFWYSVLNHNERLIQQIKNTEVSVDEWKRQKEVQKNKNSAGLFELGFSTFFLNRANRSGILKGGIIGGYGQEGKWKIDARFNKEDLIKRIYKIGLYAERIHLTNLDAIELFQQTKVIQERKANAFVYFDPPYYNKGQGLYVNFYRHKDHEDLSKFIVNLDIPWLLSYDNTPEIIELFDNFEPRFYNLSYTAGPVRKGSEVMFLHKNLSMPEGAVYEKKNKKKTIKNTPTLF